jgi:hypothetical protein
MLLWSNSVGRLHFVFPTEIQLDASHILRLKLLTTGLVVLDDSIMNFPRKMTCHIKHLKMMTNGPMVLYDYISYSPQKDCRAGCSIHLYSC